MKKTISVMICFLMIIMGNFTTSAQAAISLTSVKEQFQKKVMTVEYFNMNYRLYVPEKAEEEKVPMIVFLHGAGERGDDNESQLVHAILEPFKNPKSKFYDSVILAPQCPSYTKWVDYDWSKGNYSTEDIPETPELKMLAKLITETSERENVDKRRIYIIGLSMGGYGTWDMLVRHGDIFAAGVPICGGGDPSAAAKLADMPIYTFHGSADSSVSVENTREMVRAINDCGKNNLIYVEYEGMEHGIWNDAITYKGDDVNPSLEDWLFSKVKPVPESVNLDKTTHRGAPGSGFKLNVDVEPEGTFATPVFESSDSAVAEVDENGNVKLISEGHAVITVKCGELISVCSVTVAAPDADKDEPEKNYTVPIVVSAAAVVVAGAVTAAVLMKRKKIRR